jgi:hypothetical protein
VDAESAKAKAAEAKQIENRKQAQSELKTYLDGVDTMFGFKMHKDETKIPKVRQQLFEYIDSGQFSNDILKDPQAITDVAWFVKNKETIIKALSNKGKQAAKEEFLNDIHEVSKDNTERMISNTDDNADFNPSKFTTNIDD